VRSAGTHGIDTRAGACNTPAAERSVLVPTSPWRRLAQNLAFHDWLALGYFLSLAVVLQLKAPGAEAARWALWLLGSVALAVGIGRIRERPVRAAVLAYRFGLLGGMLASYLLLRSALPLVSLRSVDPLLHTLDRALFGIDWSEAPFARHDPFVREYLAFWYLSYFAVLVFYGVPRTVLSDHEQRAAELVVAMFVVYFLGQTLYFVVPAYGPGPYGGWLDATGGGPVTRAMLRLTGSLGARKDVFPSLHVAATSVAAAHAIRHRAGPSGTFVVVVLAFVVTNIVAATIYLGWHYVSDVVIGLALALLAHKTAGAVVSWEIRRRRRAPESPALWPALRHQATD
jgi:membrane-associated phospholipid phosphatase